MKTKSLFTIALAFVGLSMNAQNSWSPKANFGGTGRQGAVGFSIGNKGYIGTGDNGAYPQDFWEWDVSTNVWTQKAPFGGTARWGAVGFSIGTKGYIGTGTDGSYNYQDFWEYNPSANSWTQKANFAGGMRRDAVGFSIGNKGYIGTGRNSSRYNDFYEYDPTADSWTQKANFGGTARYGAVGFFIGNKGYIGTGNDVSGLFQKDFWEYNPVADSWTQKANFGGTARYFAVGFSIGNKGYIGTGGGYYQDFWEYNSSTDVWTQKTNYLNSVWLAVGFSTCTKGYIGTGSPSNYTYEKSFAEYTPSVTPAAAFTVSQTTLCVNGCINFTDMSTNVPTNWSWTFTGGTPSSSAVQNPTNICYSATGTYTATLTASNMNCSSTATKVITVNTVPATPVVTPSGTVSICQGQNVTLTLSNPCSGCTNHWTQCPTCALTSGNSLTTNIGGTWYCFEDNSCGNSANSNTVTITFNPLPAVTANASPSNAVCAGTSIILTGGGASSYIWTGGVTNGVGFVPSSTAIYAVTGTDGNSCTNTAAVTVTVNTCTGIQDVFLDESVKISPNPNSGIFLIKSEIKISDIEIRNLLGEKIYSDKINSDKTEIDLSKQQNGIYFVHFVSEKGSTVKKIIINK